MPEQLKVAIRSDDAKRFQRVLLHPDYARFERNYKDALRAVFTAILPPTRKPDVSATSAKLAELFGRRKSDLKRLGLSAKQMQGITAKMGKDWQPKKTIGYLVDPQRSRYHLDWIAEAIQRGMGEEVVSAFLGLRSRDPLPERFDQFRRTMRDIRRTVLRKRRPRPGPPAIPLTAVVLASLFPDECVLYRRQAIDYGRNAFVVGGGPGESGTWGERYSEICEFYRGVLRALRNQGVNAEDLTDAQGFVWIAYRNLWDNYLLDPAVEDAIAGIEGLAGKTGFMSDAKRRKAVELHAVKVVIASLANWTVSDVSKSNHYDLECHHVKSGRTIHVEVKGSTGAADSVFLTYREVEHAQGQFPEMVLAVVSNIKLAKDLTCSGGKLSWHHPWKPDEGLTPLAYTYKRPQATGAVPKP